MQKPRKNLTQAEVKKKIYHYCAYQERSHLEVKSKLYDLGLPSRDVDEMLSHLITENYLNEERYAKAFAGGKFRLKHWGRLKILQALESKGLTKNCIAAGLKEIDPTEYLVTINLLIDKKAQHLSEQNPFLKRDKLAQYVIQKGFEPDLVWEVLKDKIK